VTTEDVKLSMTKSKIYLLDSNVLIATGDARTAV